MPRTACDGDVSMMATRWSSRDTPAVPSLLLAQSTAELTQTVWHWPQTAIGSVALIGGFGFAAIAVVWLQRRDTIEQNAFVRGFLPVLRLLVLAVLFVVVLNPQRRTTTESFRPSEITLLVDVSGSMQQPAGDPRSSSESAQSRSQALETLFADSSLLSDLQQRHAVTVRTFGDQLSREPIRLPYQGGEARPEVGVKVDSTDRGGPIESDATPIDWTTVVEPRDPATRLGDVVERVVAEQAAGRSAGVVVFTDGASNVGSDVRSANLRAIRNETKLIAVGVGSTEPSINLAVTRLIGPTDVQAGDAFDLTAYLSADGAAGQSVEVRLRRSLDGQSPTVIDRQTVTLPEDGQPLSVGFEARETDEGQIAYEVQAELRERESRSDDNLAVRQVTVFDRPFDVLVVAGGPSRDYRFARNALFRHPSAELDILLQSGQPGISQESRELLFEFPTSKRDLYRYDVLIAFDPDWGQLTDEQLGWVRDWVSDEGGGLLAQVGDVYSPRLAGYDERLDPIRTLYPVTLEPTSLSAVATRNRDRAFPFELTDAGRAADFLQLEGDGESPVWDSFPGVFGAAPIEAIKSGATVYAEFPNLLLRGSSGLPPLVAEQRYGQGTVLYLGTTEFWRLRAVSEDVYDRLWVKLVRRAAQGRSRQGAQRVVWLLDDRDQPLGQTVPLRVRVVSPQFEPIAADAITAAIVSPKGETKAVSVSRDPRRPSEFTGQFRPTAAGRYELRLDDTTLPAISGELRVELPRLEAGKLEQDRKALLRLVEETGGTYLPIDRAKELVALLPASGQSEMIDQTLTELWDRWWVLVLLATLLAAEWLTRKLVSLA